MITPKITAAQMIFQGTERVQDDEAPWQELSDVFAALAGCGHVSGLLMRPVWPLALMLCADRVPIESTH